MSTGQPLATFNGHLSVVHFVTFSPDGKLLATCSRDRTIKLWDVDKLLPGSPKRLPELTEVRRFGQEHTSEIADVAYVPSPQGLLVATAGYDNTLRIWEMPKGDEDHVWEVPASLWNSTGGLRSLGASPDGKTIAVGDHAGRVFILDVAGSHRTLEVEPGHVKALAFSPNGKRLYVGVAHFPQKPTGAVVVYDAESWERLHQFQSIRWGVTTITPIPMTHDALVTTAGGVNGIWETDTGELRSIIAGPDSALAAAVSPDGKMLAIGFHARKRRDGRWYDPNAPGIWLYQTGSRRPIRKLIGHTAPVHGLAFTPDGRYLISGSGGHPGPGTEGFVLSWDNTLRVWDVETGEELARSVVDSDWGVFAMALLPDGRHVVTAGGHSGGPDLRLWRLPDELFPATDKAVAAPPAPPAPTSR